MIFQKVKQFVDKARPDMPAHYQNTVDWLLKLDSKVDEVMQAAAYAHDIERAFRKKEEKNSVAYKKFRADDPEYLKMHQESGAKIIRKFLIKENFLMPDIKRIYNMVLHHEEGGDFESDLIMEADSLSFFDVNAKGFVDKFLPIMGKERVKIKFNFMKNRVKSQKAKDLIEPMYQEALEYLESKDHE